MFTYSVPYSMIRACLRSVKYSKYFKYDFGKKKYSSTSRHVSNRFRRVINIIRTSVWNVFWNTFSNLLFATRTARAVRPARGVHGPESALRSERPQSRRVPRSGRNAPCGLPWRGSPVPRPKLVYRATKPRGTHAYRRKRSGSGINPRENVFNVARTGRTTTAVINIPSVDEKKIEKKVKNKKSRVRWHMIPVRK